MNKKITSIIIVILILVIAVGVWFFTRDDGGQGQETNNLFPNAGLDEKEISKRGIGFDSDEQSDEIEQGLRENKNRLFSMFQLVDSPTAGYTVIEKETGVSTSTASTTTLVRFAERGTGHIYDVDIESSKISRVSNTTIPKTKYVLFSDDGEYALFRYKKENVDGTTNYIARIGVQSTSSELGGEFLPENIQTPLFTQNNTLFYTRREGGSRTVGYLYNPAASELEAVFDLPLSEFGVSLMDSKSYIVTTKPSHTSLGYSYWVDQTSMRRIIGGLAGLNTIHLKEDTFLYSSGGSNSISSFVKEGGEIRSLPQLETLVDKCVYNEILICAVPDVIPAGDYPDDWYKGIVSFEDSFWVVDIEKDSYEILDTNNNTEGVDAINLKVSGERNYLFFIDKNDLSLWMMYVGDLEI